MSGVTFTINNDGTVTVDGTATDTITFNLTNNFISFPSGNYIINGGVDNNIRVYANPDRTQGYYSGGADSVAFNVTSELVARIQIESGTVCDNVLIKPMIRLSTELDSTFAPWENICPISGRVSTSISTTDGTDTESVSISFGTTIYGGTLNVTTGELTINTATKTYTGETDELWDGDLSINSYWSTATIGNKARGDIVCNEFKGVKVDTWNDLHDAEIAFHPTIANVLRVMYSGVANLTAFRAFLASNPLQVCYELATPTTIQLTPDELTMLKGTNSVSGDGVITITALTGDPWS